MRKIRIYQDKPLAIQEDFELDSSACHHLINVLKIKPSQELTIFNGDGCEYISTINDINKKNITVNITSIKQPNNELNFKIHLAQSLCKGNKMELVIQKAVELGVSEITPIISEYTDLKLNADRFNKKLQHWHNIIIAACSQSERNIIPKIHPPMQLTKFISQKNLFDHTKLMLDPSATKHIKDLKINTQDVITLIGPEGGFSNDELKLANENKFQTINLGPRILRTETAGLVVLSILQLQ